MGAPSNRNVQRSKNMGESKGDISVGSLLVGSWQFAVWLGAAVGVWHVLTQATPLPALANAATRLRTEDCGLPTANYLIITPRLLISGIVM